MEESRLELERRLAQLEAPGSGGMVQANLPWQDVVAAVAAILLVSLVLLWWVA